MKSIEFIESIIEFSFFFCMVVWVLLLVPMPIFIHPSPSVTALTWHSPGFDGIGIATKLVDASIITAPLISLRWFPLGLDRNALSVQTPYLSGAGTLCTQLQNGRWCWSPHRSARTRTFWPWHFGCSYQVCFECLSSKIARLTPKKSSGIQIYKNECN